MTKIAILYDFDKTLCGKDMQEYSLIPSLGYDNPKDFWKEVKKLSEEHHMDSISAYLYLLQKKYEEIGQPLTKKHFDDLGKDIVLYEGVDSWFDRINAYGKQLGLDVEHYIISSGMKEIIESVPVAERFKHIYACSYYYDENGYARWPAQVVNYTTKTQYIFRINKQVLNENDDDLNTYIDPKRRPIPLTKMVYIADGITDVPCMRLIKEYGGRSIAVYNQFSDKAKATAEKLICEGRANYMVCADYTEGSDMEKLMVMILRHMSADSALEQLEGKIQ